MKVKLTKKNIKKLWPDDKVKRAYMRREDIKKLPKKEREARWLKHLDLVNATQQALIGFTCFVISPRNLK